MKKTIPLVLIIASMMILPCRAEFKVNTHTSDNQTYPAIASNANGNFVAVWSSYRQDGDKGGIFAQRFDANCNPVGNEFQVNTTTADHQTEPAVAMNAAGFFVVAWQSLGLNQEDIFAQRFDPNGQLLGSEFLVNTYTNDKQLCPGVAMNNNGGFVVVWESINIPAQPDKRSVCARLYDSSGSAMGPEFIVNDEVSKCRYPAVAIHNSGKFVVVWIKDSSLNSVWVRHFMADGTAPYLSKIVNDTFNFTSLTRPDVAIDDIGNYVIVWDGHPSSYLEDDIYLKMYHYTHAPIHDQFIVNTYQTGAQSNPAVAMNASGEFVVTWQSDTDSNSAKIDIFGQRFPAQDENIGQPILIGDQFQINTYTLDDQTYPAVAIRENGQFVTLWQSDGQDGSGYGIFGQLGPKIRCADFNSDGFVNFADFCIIAQEWLKDENPLIADLIDDNIVDGQDLEAFGIQWLKPCYPCSSVDLNPDGKIDFLDYAFLADNWRQQGPLDGDITGNGTVNMDDLMAFVLYWNQTCGQ